MFADVGSETTAPACSDFQPKLPAQDFVGAAASAAEFAKTQPGNLYSRLMLCVQPGDYRPAKFGFWLVS